MNRKRKNILFIIVVIIYLLINTLLQASEKGQIIDIDTILKKHWEHVKTFKKGKHPSIISIDPNDSSMMIPYAFGDGGDLDEDGKYAFHENPDNFEILVVSESASYALLRAVWINDKETFDKVWKWTYYNLQHKNIQYVYKWDSKTDKVIKAKPEDIGLEKDHLISWRWVPSIKGLGDGILTGTTKSNGIWIDGWGFAADADEDIALALIFADASWGSDLDIFDYKKQAKLILNDLWEKGTIVVNGKRYLNGGTGSYNNIEPGYLSPPSYRIFEQFDPDHSWVDLVNSSYEVFRESASMEMEDGSYLGEVLVGTGGKGVGLIPDWVMVVKENGKTVYKDSEMRKEPECGADAFRGYWRIALDYNWFKSKEAFELLKPNNSPYSPNSLIKKILKSNWNGDPSKNYKYDESMPIHQKNPYDYDETGKVPRMLAHDGEYLANEVTGAGIDESNTGNRADIATNGVWLAYFGAIGDKETANLLLDPIIRKDIDFLEGDGSSGFIHKKDGWLREDKGGYYWTIHDVNVWEGDTDYYSNAWGWFGLAAYSGKAENLFNNYNKEPKNVSKINIFKLENNKKQLIKKNIDDIDLQIEIEAKGGNINQKDFLYLNIYSNQKNSIPISVKCAETEKSSNIYKGFIKIRTFSNDALDEIGASEGSTLTFKTNNKKIVKKIDPVTLGQKTLFDPCNGKGNILGGWWYSVDDKNEGNTSIIHNPVKLNPWTNKKQPYLFSKMDTIKKDDEKVYLKYTLGKSNKNKSNFEVYTILGVQLYNPDKIKEINSKAGHNLSEFKGMGVWIKGNGKKLTIGLRSNLTKDYDDYSYIIEETPKEWTYYIIKFNKTFFAQEGWGKKVPFDKVIKEVIDIQFKANSKINGEQGYFEIDEIDFLGVPPKYIEIVDDFNDNDVSDWWYVCDIKADKYVTAKPHLETNDGYMILDYNMGSHEEVWACTGKNLTPRNLDGYHAVSLDIYGKNSGNPFTIELADSGNERFSIIVRDDYEGKKTFNIPFKYFKQRSWQPTDAVINNEFDYNEIKLISFNFITGSGSLKIDNIRFTKEKKLIPEIIKFAANFEDGSFNSFTTETEGIQISNTDEKSYKSNKSLKIILNGNGKQSIKYGLPNININEKLKFNLFIPEENNLKGVLIGILDKDFNWTDKWINGEELKQKSFNTIFFTIPNKFQDNSGKYIETQTPIKMLKIEFHPEKGNFNNVILYLDEVDVE